MELEKRPFGHSLAKLKSDNIERTFRSVIDNLGVYSCISFRDPEVQGLVVAPVVVGTCPSRGKNASREESMKYEMNRLLSFLHYPGENKPFRTRFAQAGFFYNGNGDEVECYCCKQRLMNWTDTDVPNEVHAKIAPRCLFLTNNAEVNYKTTPGIDVTGDQNSEGEQVSLQICNTFFRFLAQYLLFLLFRCLCIKKCIF